MTEPGQGVAASHTPTIVLCLLAAFCEGIDLQVAGIAAPGLSGEFHPDPTLLGYFFSASTVGLLVGALVGGYLADRVGRKAVLVWSVGVFAVCSLLTMLAWDINSLIAARLITGLGLGGAYPNMLALASEASATNRRNANVTLVYAGTPIGGALVSLGSSLTAPEHWRWLFAFGGIAPLLIVPLMALYLRESPLFRQQRQRAHEAEPAPRVQFIAILSHGRATRTLMLWACFVLTLIIQYLLLNWLPTLMIGSGLTKPQAAYAQIGFNVGGAAAATLIGHLLEGRWRRPAVYAAYVALPLLMLALSQARGDVLTMTLLATGIGCAVLSALAFLYACAPICYPTHIRGTGVGAAVGAGRVGSIIGPLIGGALVGMGHGSGQLLRDLLPVAIAAGLCAVVLVTMNLEKGHHAQEAV